MSEQPKASACAEHHFAIHMRGGEPLSVRICTLCGEIDWADLREQIDALLPTGRREPCDEPAWLRGLGDNDWIYCILPVGHRGEHESKGSTRWRTIEPAFPAERPVGG